MTSNMNRNSAGTAAAAFVSVALAFWLPGCYSTKFIPASDASVDRKAAPVDEVEIFYRKPDDSAKFVGTLIVYDYEGDLEDVTFVSMVARESRKAGADIAWIQKPAPGHHHGALRSVAPHHLAGGAAQHSGHGGGGGGGGHDSGGGHSSGSPRMMIRTEVHVLLYRSARLALLIAPVGTGPDSLERRSDREKS